MNETCCSTCHTPNRRGATYCRRCSFPLQAELPAFRLESGAAWQGNYGKDRQVAYELSYAQAVDTRLGVYAVIDGVSDSDAGRKAAHTVQQLLSYPHTRQWTWSVAIMQALLRYCNNILLNRQEITGETGAVAVTTAHVCGSIAKIASVGHTRGYLLRDGAMRQITSDHTIANGLARAGHIAPEAVATHSLRTHLYSYLGMPEPTIDAVTMGIDHDDRLVLCTNGIWDVIPVPQMTSIVRNNTPQAACDTLVEMARNSAAVVDNATVVVVHVAAVDQEEGKI